MPRLTQRWGKRCGENRGDSFQTEAEVYPLQATDERLTACMRSPIAHKRRLIRLRGEYTMPEASVQAHGRRIWQIAISGCVGTPVRSPATSGTRHRPTTIHVCVARMPTCYVSGRSALHGQDTPAIRAPAGAATAVARGPPGSYITVVTTAAAARSRGGHDARSCDWCAPGHDRDGGRTRSQHKPATALSLVASRRPEPI